MSPVSGVVDLSFWVSESNDEVPHDEFILYTYERTMRGEYPSVFSFFGHAVPGKFVEVTYIGRGKKHLRCLVTFKRRLWDEEAQLTKEYYVLTVPAWQGDNNIIHLMEVLPGEDMNGYNLLYIYKHADRPDYPDFLDRIRRHYSDAELMEIAPEVFYHPDPVRYERVFMFDINGKPIKVENRVR